MSMDIGFYLQLTTYTKMLQSATAHVDIVGLVFNTMNYR
jgi:hypothetical protein